MTYSLSRPARQYLRMQLVNDFSELERKPWIWKYESFDKPGTRLIHCSDHCRGGIQKDLHPDCSSNYDKLQ